MYICDRLAERERVILVTIFVAIRYRVSTVFQREISFVFKKHGTRYGMVPVPTVRVPTRYALCINLFLLI